MKYTVKAQYLICTLILLVFSLFFSFSATAEKHANGPAAASPLDYQIARWFKFKKAAFSITFDDNYRFQVTQAMPLLNQYNYKATYFIVTNRVGNGYAPGWDTLNMLALQGHEIGSHSKNHADFYYLSQCPQCADSMVREFRDSRDTINARIPSQQCETFAWPFGAVNAASIEVGKQYYMACRGSINQYEGSDPANFYNIMSQHVYHDTPLETVNGYVDTIVYDEGWLVERWHGYRVLHDTNGYEPVPVGEFGAHLNHVAQNENSLWIATLGHVVKYIRERDSSVFSLIDSSGYSVTFSLRNNLPDTLFHYNVPLTVRVKVYGKMADVYMITQGNDTLPFTISYLYGAKYLYVDAIPNHGFIELHLPDPTGIQGVFALHGGAGNFPNPFISVTNIVFDLREAGLADIFVCDLKGRVLRDYSGLYEAGRNSIEFDGSGLPAGVYYCIIRSRERKAVVSMVHTK